MNKYVALIQGPKEYLKDEVRVEKFEITQEDIADCREGFEEDTDEEIVEYLLEEYQNAWEQRWCGVQIFTLAQYRIIDPNFQW